MNHINSENIDSLERWAITREAILGAVQQVMGDVPGRNRAHPPAWSVIDETAFTGYTRYRITYESEPDSSTSAFLCLPDGIGPDQPAAGVLCLHPTNHDHGYEDGVGLSGRPNRSYASELAERGFVTIAPSYPLMASYQPDIDTLGYVSGTMKAIWDNSRALDLLDSLNEVVSGSYGAIGHSLGGHNSVYSAVFDDRIQATVSNCGLDSYLDYKDGNIQGWSQKRYMPRIGTYGSLNDIPFDFHDLISALAPRACLVSAPVDDDNFKWRSAAAVVEAARMVYRLHNAEENIRIIHPECAHDFPVQIRQTCYDFLAQHVGSHDG